MNYTCMYNIHVHVVQKGAISTNYIACLCRKDRLEAEAKSGSEKFEEVYYHYMQYFTLWHMYEYNILLYCPK